MNTRRAARLSRYRKFLVLGLSTAWIAGLATIAVSAAAAHAG